MTIEEVEHNGLSDIWDKITNIGGTVVEGEKIGGHLKEDNYMRAGGNEQGDFIVVDVAKKGAENDFTLGGGSGEVVFERKEKVLSFPFEVNPN